MKILQLIKEEIVPLSRKQHIVLFTIIACIFQFTLFYAPALADAAVQDANVQGNVQEMTVSNDSMVKTATMDPAAANLSIQNKATSTATSTVVKTEVVKESTHTITAYNSDVAQTDDTPCITANGFDVCKNGVEDTIATNFLPFGTKVKIPELFGDRIFTVRDRMNKKHATRVDVWMKNRTEAVNFGVKVAKIQVIK